MRIPIKAARDIGKRHKLTHCFILGYDGHTTCMTTWGKSTEDAGQTADWANRVKQRSGWPAALFNAQPSRVRKLQTRIEELEKQLTSCDPVVSDRTD